MSDGRLDYDKLVSAVKAMHDGHNNVSVTDPLVFGGLRNMNLPDKVEIIKRYADKAEPIEKYTEEEKRQHMINAAKRSSSGTTGLGPLLNTAIPMALPAIVFSKNPRLAAKRVGIGLAAMAPFSMATAGVLGALRERKKMALNEELHDKTQAILNKIRETKDEEERDRHAYTLLANSKPADTYGQSRRNAIGSEYKYGIDILANTLRKMYEPLANANDA